MRDSNGNCILFVCVFGWVLFMVAAYAPLMSHDVSDELFISSSDTGEKVTLSECVKIENGRSDNKLTYIANVNGETVSKTIEYSDDIKYIASDHNAVSYTERESLYGINLTGCENVVIIYDSSQVNLNLN